MGLAQLQRNAGTFGIVRAAAVLGIFVWLGATLFTDLGSWVPLASFAVGVVVPIALRRVLVDHVDSIAKPLQWFFYALVGATMLAPLWFDTVPKDGWQAEAFVGSMAFAVALYLSTWFCLLSHPDVSTARARGE